MFVCIVITGHQRSDDSAAGRRTHTYIWATIVYIGEAENIQSKSAVLDSSTKNINTIWKELESMFFIIT